MSGMSNEQIMVLLEPGETIAQRRAKERLRRECDMVMDEIRRNPGRPGKRALAEAVGLGIGRVELCIAHINSPDSNLQRVGYGRKTAKAGMYAGEERSGWFPMQDARYQTVLDAEDEHSSSVETGVRRSRLARLVYAYGLPTRVGRGVVASIEARLEVDVAKMSETDFDAFLALVETELEVLAENGT